MPLLLSDSAIRPVRPRPKSLEARFDQLPEWRDWTGQRPVAMQLAELGRRIRSGLLNAGLASALLDRDQLLAAMTSIDPARVSVSEALALGVSHLSRLGNWEDQTVTKMAQEMARMAAFLEHHGAGRVTDIESAELSAWIDSATERYGTWRNPALSTRHFRLSTARLFFRLLRDLQIRLVDPTLDIVLPPRGGVGTRPLTDDEELICRLITHTSLTETRRPVAWALGQATATTAEQAAIVVADLHLEDATVWIHGSHKRTPRHGSLTSWGVAAIADLLERIGDRPGQGLVYSAQTSPESGTASVCKAVSEVLNYAGYTPSADLRPGSLPAWAGRKVFDETGRIEDAARALGVKSLDRAAAIIRWDWRV